eukprot:8179795-Alexandrium_andersonii.AAC.1
MKVGKGEGSEMPAWVRKGALERMKEACASQGREEGRGATSTSRCAKAPEQCETVIVALAKMRG